MLIGVFEICKPINNCMCDILLQSALVPLYLGADIFSNTDIRVENHPRYHAKFAKKGYATKLTFSPGDETLTAGCNMHTFVCIFCM